MERRTCKVESCENIHKARGYCHYHYRKYMSWGDPLAVDLHRYKHGMKGTKEWFAWSQMRSRCSNPNMASYHNYGGRGIKVCEQWLHSFVPFYNDVGPAPSPSHSLDRINVDGDYEPGNARWATSKMQANNRRNCRKITFEGKTLTIAQWAELRGFRHEVLRSRIEAGWHTERALNEPVRERSGEQ